MVLDDTNILQADATVIAGLLILLTLLSFKGASGAMIPYFLPAVALNLVMLKQKIPPCPSLYG